MKQLLYLLILLSIIGTSSCGSYTYIPSSVTVPLLSERGENQIQIGLHTSLESSVIGVGVSYAKACPKGIGLLINGNYGGSRGLSSTHAEMGLGYYHKFMNGLIIEGYGGFGMGISKVSGTHYIEEEDSYDNGYSPWLTILNPTNYEDYDYKINHVKSYVQTNIGYKKDIFSVAFANKLSILTYSNNGIPKDEKLKFPSDGIHPFYETALTFRVGKRKAKFFTQIQNNIPLKKIDFKASRLIISTGIEVHFNRGNK